MVVLVVVVVIVVVVVLVVLVVLVVVVVLVVLVVVVVLVVLVVVASCIGCTSCSKAVGSGKGGKALALPLFVSSKKIYLTRLHTRKYTANVIIVYAFIMASFKEGDGPHQPKNYPFPKRAF